MSTKNQRTKIYYKRPLRNKRPKFNDYSRKNGQVSRSLTFSSSPQRKGIVIRMRICTPRKPNSARRPIVKVYLYNRKKLLAHVPGQRPTSSHELRRYNKVLVEGVGARDLPTVNYTCIRGVFDLQPLDYKTKRRSIYGVKKHPDLKTHIRRIFRNI